MRLLPQRLAEVAARAPRSVALYEPAGAAEVATDYGALAAEVGRVAGTLRALGVGSGEPVALLSENSAQSVAALYGILGAGAVAVTLNAAARAADLAAYMAHAGARVLLAAPEHPELAALEARLLPDAAVLRLGKGAFDAAEPAAPAPLDAARPAVVLYTSGTTAAPKGVLLTHGNLAANADAIIESLSLRPDERTLCLLPFYYAYGASVLHTHLSQGAALLLEAGLTFPAQVLARAARLGATGLPGVPATFTVLLRRGHLKAGALPALRYITQAGGPLPPPVADQLRAALPGVSLYLMYGQTEATARLTCLPPEALEAKRGSCGRALSGVELRVVDPETGAVLPPGARGEICARGPNITPGYHRAPEATAAALRDGWLHTGDFGHLDAEGFLFLEGRRSDQIKVGAHRISPLEIEAVVSAVPGVAEVCAVGLPDELLGQVVAVAVVPAAEAAPPTQLAVQGACREALAAYKVPRRVAFVPALPRTASGKVQRFQVAALFENPPPTA